MKTKVFFSIIFIISSINVVFAQIVDWKQQIVKYVNIGTTPNNSDIYYWHEESIKGQGIHINLIPTEIVKIYAEQGNNRICFGFLISPTSSSNFLTSIDVRVDNAGWMNLYIGNPKSNHVWSNSADFFSSLGGHNLKVKYTVAGSSTIYYREYYVKVVPKSDKLFFDQYGNTMRLWKGNSPNPYPLLLSPGFDAYNTKPEQYYRYAGSELFDCLLNNGYDVYVLYYKYNPQDLRNNAAVYSSAVKYISNIWNNSNNIVAAGISMGGVITRYALAKAEDIGSPLPVNKWLSLDAPHKGAYLSKEFQNYLKEKTSDDFDRYANNNEAAKILLLYNAYDPNNYEQSSYEDYFGYKGPIHTAFYNELNSLNGDGYPHLTYNIGVSFSTNTPNPHSGKWLNIKTGMLINKDFDLKYIDRLAGSYLPGINKDPSVVLPFWGLLWATLVVTQYQDPTFISHESSLDIVNNQSKFDNTIIPPTTSFHDVVPSAIICQIVERLLSNDKIVSPLILTYNIGNISNEVLSKDITVLDGGKLCANANIPTEYGTGPYPVYGSIVNVSLGSLCSTNGYTIRVKNNGQFILGESTHNNKAIVRIKSGSTLKINNGGKLIINNNSKLVIEPGAEIIYEQGAEIQLLGDNAVLEIQGTTRIGNNATFTFTGSGFIRYNVPFYTCGTTNVCPSIKAGVNSRFMLIGSSPDDLVLEVKNGDDDMGMMYPEDQLALFRIINGKVNLRGTLNLGCRYMISNCNFIGGGGLIVWGAANSIITGCTFDGVIIIGNLFVNNNLLKISNSTIKNNSSLITNGRGVDLTNVNFNNCVVGWDAEDLQMPSKITSCNFSDNYWGIFIYNSSALSSLLVKESIISNNNTGIITYGPMTLNIRCGSINNNDIGVEIHDNGVLSMSSYDNTGFVDLSNNPYRNIILDNSGQIYLDQGYNKLFIYKSNQGLENNTRVIYGTINSCPSSPITANNNQWYSYDPSLGISSSKYELLSSTCSSDFTIYENNNTIPFISCPTDPFEPPVIIDYPNPLALCNNCTNIHTVDYDDVPYNQAVRNAISFMELEDSTANDLIAINRFKQILMLPIDSTNSNMLWLAGLAFTKMNIALANAFETGKISEADNVSSLHPSVQEALDVYERLTKTTDAGNYKEQFYLQYNKAHIYALAGKRNEALAILNAINLTNCYIGQSELRLLERSKTLLNAEQLIVSGSVSREKFNSIYVPVRPPLYKPTVIDSTAIVSTTAILGNAVTIGVNTMIEQNVVIGDSVSIGNNVIIKQNTAIGQGTVIGDNTSIEKDVTIGKDNVIGKNVKIKKNCITGNDVILSDNTDFEEGVKIGGLVSIGANTKLKTNVNIGDGSSIGTNGNFDKGVKIGGNVVILNSPVFKKDILVGDRSFIGNNVTINNNAKIGSDAVIGNGITIGSYAKICDTKTVNNNLANNGAIGNCAVPSIPSVPLQITYDCSFASANAKIRGNFYNGFKAQNADTTKHNYCTERAIKFIPDKLSASYLWNFGDCTTSTDESPMHIYTKPGIYVITLTITIKCVNYTTIGAITVLPNPDVDFTSNPEPVCSSSNKIVFNKGSDLGDLRTVLYNCQTGLCTTDPKGIDSTLFRVKYNWSFGDSLPAFEEIFSFSIIAKNLDSNVTYNYPSSGAYPVSLKATLQQFNKITSTWLNTDCIKLFSDTVYPGSVLDANVFNDTTFCLDDSVRFTTSVVGGKMPYTYQLFFDQEEQASVIRKSIPPIIVIPEAQESFEYSAKFDTLGEHTIKLIVSDALGCSDTVVKQIEVILCNPPLAISGILYESAFCGSAPVANDTLVIINSGGNIVPSIDPAITDEQGEFNFIATELAMLDTTLLYGINTKSGFALSNNSFKTIPEWLNDCPLSLNLKNVNQEWVSKFSHTDTTSNISTAISLDENIYVTGAGYDNQFVSDYVTIKYNPLGEQQWIARYSHPLSWAYPTAITTNQYGDCYVSGYSGDRLTTVKYNTSGVEQWVANYPGSNCNGAANIIDTAGNIYVTGSDIPRIITIKYNSSGDIVWSRTFNNYGCVSRSIKIDHTGDIIVAGFIEYIDSSAYVILKYSHNGNLKWSVLYNKGGIERLSSMAIDNLDNIYITGYHWTNGYIKSECLTVKYNSNGVKQWDIIYSNGNFAGGNDIAIDASNYVYVASQVNFGQKVLKYNPNGILEWLGETALWAFPGAGILKIDNSGFVYITGTDGIQFSTIKFDTDGNQIWNEKYGEVGTNDLAIYDMKISPNTDNVYITGRIGSNYTTFDFITLKYSQCPSTAELRSAIFSETENSESDIQVINFNENTITVYPNPYKDNTLIEMVLISDADVSLEVYTITGQCVANVYTGPEKVGTYTYEFSAKKLGYSAGTYILKATVNNEVSSYWLVEMK